MRELLILFQFRSFLVCSETIVGVLLLLSMREEFILAEGTPTVAGSRCLPSRMGCNIKERVVMGDMYRYLKRYEQAVRVFQCFLWRRRQVSPDICVTDVAS